ncbi:MAG: hypothetical protein ACI92S_005503 [Planctomycetaceae bacterium]
MGCAAGTAAAKSELAVWPLASSRHGETTATTRQTFIASRRGRNFGATSLAAAQKDRETRRRDCSRSLAISESVSDKSYKKQKPANDCRQASAKVKDIAS